jgi:hypothetical protein
MNGLSPHSLLLLAALVPSEFPVGRLEQHLRAHQIRWDDALERATQNRVLPFVVEMLHGARMSQLVPPGVLAQWGEEADRRIRRVDLVLHQLREIGVILSRSNVEALVYKGIQFQTRYYTRSQPRSFGDIDLIVPRARAKAATRALEAAGYRLPDGGMPFDYYLRFHLNATFAHPGATLPVELHWALESPYADRFDPTSVLLSEGKLDPSLGPSLLSPSSDDALAMMAIHFEKHLGFAASLRDRESRIECVIAGNGLLWVWDILCWLRQQGPRDGDATLGRIRQLAAERSLVIAMRLALDMDPTAIPDWARRLAERLPHGHPLVRGVALVQLRAAKPRRPGSRRPFLLRPIPHLDFRPISVLVAILPQMRVPGVEQRSLNVRARQFLHTLILVGQNVAALVRWSLQRRRKSTGPLELPRSRGW